jgi:hypothetical protein
MSEGFVTSASFEAAAVGAVIAALGYLAKMFIELVSETRRRRRERRAALIRLQSLLRASKAAFKMQNILACNLLDSIRENHSGIDVCSGFDRVFSQAFDHLNDAERELHTIVRGYTISALKPTNEQLLEWVRTDTYFKACRRSVKHELARELAELETHLLLWLAKYESWIPPFPRHALVYLDDEQRHGIGFPQSIDKTVTRVLSA